MIFNAGIKSKKKTSISLHHPLLSFFNTYIHTPNPPGIQNAYIQNENSLNSALATRGCDEKFELASGAGPSSYDSDVLGISEYDPLLDAAIWKSGGVAMRITEKSAREWRLPFDTPSDCD